MSIHIAPVVLHVRGFNKDVDVDKPLFMMSEPYDFSLVVVINDDGTARLMGLDGSISNKDRRRLATRLMSYGAKRVEWRHNGVQKHLNLIKQDNIETKT